MLPDSTFMNTDREEKVRIVLAAVDRRQIRRSMKDKDVTSQRQGN